LGTVLLILGIGALVGMQLSGPLIDRFGSESIAVFGGCAVVIVVLAPLAATTFSEAALGAFLLGVATGHADVAMNAAAAGVERLYGRPIMASFHGAFSVGTVFGSLTGAAGFALGLGRIVTATCVSVCCLVILGSAAAVLLRRPRRATTDSEQPGLASPASAASPPVRARRQHRVYVLAVLAFLLFLVEGSAMDWSSLHAQQHLAASPTWGSMAFGSFVAAMMLGRFTVDRLAERLGPVLVFRWGSAVAFIGLGVVVLSPVLPLTLVGWVIFGVQRIHVPLHTVRL
jgi:Na+/melibiose symporter-like transporter